MTHWLIVARSDSELKVYSTSFHRPGDVSARYEFPKEWLIATTDDPLVAEKLWAAVEIVLHCAGPDFMVESSEHFTEYLKRLMGKDVKKLDFAFHRSTKRGVLRLRGQGFRDLPLLHKIIDATNG